MKETINSKIGQKLKCIRIAHNDLQEDLSRKSGVAASTISKYEHGSENMNINKIEQILKPYNISLYIFFESILAKKQEF